MSRNLKNIKVGDRVWVDDDRKRIICTVIRLTPKQIVTDWPWDKKGARFYRGRISRYDQKPEYRKIGYSGWYGSEIQAIATKAECEKYDTEQAAAKQRADEAAQARQEKENQRDSLRQLFGRRMVSVGESYNIEKAQWRVDLYLTTDGVQKLVGLLDGLSAEELPSWTDN